jgi:hypothetical protein
VEKNCFSALPRISIARSTTLVDLFGLVWLAQPGKLSLVWPGDGSPFAEISGKSFSCALH